MVMRPVALRPPALTGSRIRDRRTALGLRQGHLAQSVGISASYLNLIEHNKRRIGGKLLNDLARALDVEPASLSEGADATLFDALQSAAAENAQVFETSAETDRIDELAGRFPGWAGLVATQHKRIVSLQGLVDGLHDRLTHDPVLSEAMHEVLSTVAAIRSTADILAREPDLDPAWRGRFHRNLHQEAERLSARATGMLAYFEDQGANQGAFSTPQETVEAFFDAVGHHLSELEVGGPEAVQSVLDGAAGMEDPATRAMAEDLMARYAQDAKRLPLETFLPAAQAVDFDPEPLLALAGGDVALVLRRLACLPGIGEGMVEGAPGFGLAICDASGALLFRRRLTTFSIPRFGAGCALWPLYRALGRPMVPDRSVLELPNGTRFWAWAIAQPVAQPQFGQAPVMHATMLLRPIPNTQNAPLSQAQNVGPGCQVCPRDQCPARRMASLVSA